MFARKRQTSSDPLEQKMFDEHFYNEAKERIAKREKQRLNKKARAKVKKVKPYKNPFVGGKSITGWN